MNREIKFRVWDKYKKQMYPISSIDYDIFSQEIRIIAVGHENGMCTAYNKNHNSEKCDITALELMQYTGLHDENGKEIYEGDILKGTFYGFPMPEYDYVFQIYWDEKEKGFMANYFEPSECKVIGNIYDNPELLGGE